MIECSRGSPDHAAAEAKETQTMATEAPPITLHGWALVLGASSGFCAATSMALARAGLNIFGVHLDRKATWPNPEKLCANKESVGRAARFYNITVTAWARRSVT